VRPPARRWLIVAALFMVTFGIATPLAAYGVFLPVLAESFAWSRGAISTALSINLLLGGLAGFGIGALADRHGPRVMLALTVALAGAGFALVSMVDALWHLYLFVGVMGGVGMSSFYLLSASTVTRWFDEGRGLALALVLVGFNLGYISGGPLAAWLIARVGWRGAYALLGSGCGLLTMLAALTVRLPRAAEVTSLLRPARHAEATGVAAPSGGAPPARELSVTLRDALADPRQWYLNFAWLLLGGLAFMVSVHIVPFARDQGIGLAGASLALTAYGVGSVGGRLAAGVVSDRRGTITTIRVAYVIETLALVTMGTFTVVLAWRLVRRARLGGVEQAALRLLSVAGLVGIVWTGRIGGKLVFEHAAGIPAATMQVEMQDREAGHHHHPGEEEEDEHAAPADSAKPAGHTHPPGTPPHQH